MIVTILEDAFNEPVQLEQVKVYLRIDHNYEDELLVMLISASRVSLEQYTGLSFRPKTLRVEFNYSGAFYVPYGPVTEILSVKDEDDNDVDYTFKNGCITLDFDGLYFIEYKCGYSVLPTDLKLAIMKEAVTQYEVRENIVVGTISADLSNSAKKLAQPYRRVLWLL